MHERHARSVAKGVSWRFFASLDTLILAYLFTGSVVSAASIGLLEVATKVLWYYLHERAWLALPHERLHPRFSPHLRADARVRSVLKALTWRVVGAFDTILIALFITGRLGVSLSIGGVELFTKLALYYLHERLWLNVAWGVYAEPRHHPHLRAVIEDAARELRRTMAALGWALLCVLFLFLTALIVRGLRG